MHRIRNRRRKCNRHSQKNGGRCDRDHSWHTSSLAPIISDPAAVLGLRFMSETGPRAISNPLKWTICIVAALGFLFDIYVVLVGPLILQPALIDLGRLKPGTPEYRDWAGYLFWIPPLVGGFCGLWGGYLADRFGRRRILTYSILIYAFSATASGLAATVPSLLLFRTLSFAGTCVEFVAAVAWLAEVFPDPKTREAVLGYT